MRIELSRKDFDSDNDEIVDPTFSDGIMDKTLDYYNQNAEQFSASTKDIAFTHMQDKFLNLLKDGAYILDFGCGSGRDTKYFLEKGYKVDAIDGSTELCKIASELTGINVKNMFFEELGEFEKYDGIWACSSILHVERSKLSDIIKKMQDAIIDNGVIYTSFKYGDFEGIRNGRFFNYMTEEVLADMLKNFPQISVIEQWITEDVRPGRESEKWLNVLLRKE